MIIDKAERFGLSQIYQLRGRIGRGDDQAYAYLFISDESRLTKDAGKRLAASWNTGILDPGSRLP